jgi:hypothetical protein
MAHAYAYSDTHVPSAQRWNDGDVTQPVGDWEQQRRLLDQLASARSGKHGAFIVLRELWKWFAVGLPRRLWPRTLVVAAFVFGLIGLVVGGVLEVLGAPGSLVGYSAGIGAVAGIAIALAAFSHGVWLRRRMRRAVTY